ncbi:MAG: ribbon-helix-helix domain-containing protein [Anaerolineales bacterium]|jgi:metal-responsive CopG/Arc/MetJ family transcriptional regulator|nr:ribbon-helix-helix domain-containing protein [Anaerolineales bacterium]
MPKEKVAVTIEKDLLVRLDRVVAEGRYSSRSNAVEAAVEERLARIEGTRLARETAKLDPKFEQALADEGLAGDLSEWPEY